MTKTLWWHLCSRRTLFFLIINKIEYNDKTSRSVGILQQLNSKYVFLFRRYCPSNNYTNHTTRNGAINLDGNTEMVTARVYSFPITPFRQSSHTLLGKLENNLTNWRFMLRKRLRPTFLRVLHPSVACYPTLTCMLPSYNCHLYRFLTANIFLVCF